MTEQRLRDPARLAALAAALESSADEVMSFPHPSQCDHLHSAFALMREAAVIVRALAEQEPIGHVELGHDELGTPEWVSFNSAWARTLPHGNGTVPLYTAMSAGHE